MNRIRLKLKYKCHGYIILPYICFITLALIILFTMVDHHEFWSGYDTYFHMNTIYEDAMQIKTGHFSYFISMFGFERSGRIVNSLYGPIFSYLLGAFLLLCGSWVRFEFWLFFITLVIAGSSIYMCARTLHTDRAIAMILAMIYMISRPIMIVWVWNFEYTGLGDAILLPFVIWMGIKILQQRRIRVIPLAVLMAICLQIHLMTTLIAALALIPFVVGGFILTRDKIEMIKNGVYTVILAFCLSGNIFGAIYDVYSSNHVVPTFPNFYLQAPVVNRTLFFNGRDVSGLGWVYMGMLVAVVLLTIVQFRHVTLVDGCLLLDDVLFIWLSSAYFPWERLLKIIPSLSVIVQYPIRFIGVLFITTTLLLGHLVSRFRFRAKVIVSIILLIPLIMSVSEALTTVHRMSRVWQSDDAVKYWVRPSRYGAFSKDFHRGNMVRAAIRSHDLGRGVNVVHKITPDYLPTTPRLNIYNYYRWPIGKQYYKDLGKQRGYHKFTRDHQLGMVWTSDSTRRRSFPLVKYAHTNVVLNHHVIHPRTTLIGTMLIKPKRGKNEINIQYQPGWRFKLLSIITLISWSVIILKFGSRLRYKERQ